MVAASALLFAGHAAWAGCCDVLKVDPEIPTSTIRVCSPDAAGGCGDVLFAGSLSVGESQNVCVAGGEIVYQEWDADSSDFGPPVNAVCEGQPVEI